MSTSCGRLSHLINSSRGLNSRLGSPFPNVAAKRENRKLTGTPVFARLGGGGATFVNKTMKASTKRLLELLGGQEELPPNSLKEAIMMHAEPLEKQSLPLCTGSGKVCFSSESMAKGAARRRLNKGANTGKLRAYRCERCNYWHITSSFHR